MFYIDLEFHRSENFIEYTHLYPINLIAKEQEIISHV